MYKKNKRGQSSQKTIISILLLLLIGGTFALGHSSNQDDNRDEVANTPDNTHTNDLSGGNYEKRNEPKIEPLLTNLTNNNNGKIEVTNCVDDICELKDLDTNTTQTYTIKDLTKYVGELENGDIIQKIWYNNEFDVEGFNKYFQAVLIYNENWRNYKLLWSIENENFVIPELKLKTMEDIGDTAFYFHYMGGINRNFEYFKTRANLKDELYISYSGHEIEDLSNNVNSIISITENNELVILKGIANYGSGQYDTYHFITSNEFEDCVGGVSGGIGNTCNYGVKQFSVNDIKRFSYDRIAVTSPTRTTGFNLVSITKQEMTYSGNRDEKQAKILSKEKFDEVLKNGIGGRPYTKFSDVNINEIMSNFQDNAISLWSDTINHNAYGLGTSKSEDFDIADGFVIDGYFTNQENLSSLEVGSYEFNPSASLGLVMDDTGKVNIKGSQIIGENFGKFTFNQENSSLMFSGTAYVVNDVQENGQWVSLWDRVYAGMINLFDYSFDYSQWLTQSVTNGKFSPVDVYDSCGINGCSYGYVSTFKDNDNSDIQLVTQKPITELLGYGDKQYWAFWKLETKDNSKGCLIIDMPTDNIGRIPVSVCDDEITGMNSYAQFKMLGVDEE